jgi:GGDEF domain-containing protein
VRFAEPDDIAMVGRRMVGLVCSSAVLSKSEEIGISVSAGGTVAEAEEGPKEVVARADRLLYRSKVAGGGRITLPQRGPVESSSVSRLDDPPG